MAALTIRLPPKQQRAVLLLSAGLSNTAVAEAIGVTERTVANWRRIEAFEKAIEKYIELRRQAFEARLYALHEKSIGELERMLEATRSDGKPNTEIRALAVRIHLAAAVRMAARYKELQAAGLAPKGPIIMMPAGTRLFAGPPPAWIKPEDQKVIDVKATDVSGTAPTHTG